MQWVDLTFLPRWSPHHLLCSVQHRFYWIKTAVCWPSAIWMEWKMETITGLWQIHFFSSSSSLLGNSGGLKCALLLLQPWRGRRMWGDSLLLWLRKAGGVETKISRSWRMCARRQIDTLEMGVLLWWLPCLASMGHSGGGAEGRK